MSKTKMQWLVDIGWEKHKIAGHYSRIVEFLMNMPDDISIEEVEELCKKLQDINLPLEVMAEGMVQEQSGETRPKEALTEMENTLMDVVRNTALEEAALVADYYPQMIRDDSPGYAAAKETSNTISKSIRGLKQE